MIIISIGKKKPTDVETALLELAGIEVEGNFITGYYLNTELVEEDVDELISHQDLTKQGFTLNIKSLCRREQLIYEYTIFADFKLYYDKIQNALQTITILSDQVKPNSLTYIPSNEPQPYFDHLYSYNSRFSDALEELNGICHNIASKEESIRNQYTHPTDLMTVTSSNVEHILNKYKISIPQFNNNIAKVYSDRIANLSVDTNETVPISIKQVIFNLIDKRIEELDKNYGVFKNIEQTHAKVIALKDLKSKINNADYNITELKQLIVDWENDNSNINESRSRIRLFKNITTTQKMVDNIKETLDIEKPKNSR